MWKKSLTSIFVILMACKIYASDFGYSQLMSIPAVSVNTAIQLEPSTQLPLILMPNYDSETKVSGLTLIALKNDKLASTIWQKKTNDLVVDLKLASNEVYSSNRKYVAYVESGGYAHVLQLDLYQMWEDTDITPPDLIGLQLQKIDLAVAQGQNTNILYFMIIDVNGLVQLYRYDILSKVWTKLNDLKVPGNEIKADGSKIILHLINNVPYFYVNQNLYYFDFTQEKFIQTNYSGGLNTVDFIQCSTDDHHLCLVNTIAIPNFFTLYDINLDESACTNNIYSEPTYSAVVNITASGNKAYLAYTGYVSNSFTSQFVYKAAMANLTNCEINEMGIVENLGSHEGKVYSGIGSMLVVDPMQPKKLNHYGYYVSTFIGASPNLYISAIDCATCKK